MKFPFVFRLWTLIGALLVVAGGTVYELSSIWHRIEQLQSKFTSAQLESFQLASEIRRDFLPLNNSMLSYALVRDPRQWTEFAQGSSNLDQWIDAHDPNLHPNSLLTTDEERNAFKELNLAYDDYVHSAWAVRSNGLPALVRADQLAQLDAFNAQSQRMRDMIRRLSDAHRAAEGGFFADASASLAGVRLILSASIGMLLALVAVIGWVIYHDMIAPLRTRLVQSQTLLERQEKLATLGTLAAGIAHEIRNPLTSLKARLYTLEKHLQSVPAARKDTDILNSEISRLERIVQDILSFARPSDPKMQLIAADALLREIKGLMSPDLEGRGVQVLVESNPELLIRADSSHLKQVLINLVRNSVEAIDGAGKITLRARAAQAPLAGRETNTVILEVIDNGKGIPPDVEKRLFDPFFSTKETGTGLGLPIAARIVEKHGGIIQYQTQPGRGTTFGVVLPRQIGDTASSANNENVASP